VLPEEALGVVLPDLLARHGDGGREWKPGRLVTGAGRAGGRRTKDWFLFM
jgi:hypothetical protein